MKGHLFLLVSVQLESSGGYINSGGLVMNSACPISLRQTLLFLRLSPTDDQTPNASKSVVRGPKIHINYVLLNSKSFKLKIKISNSILGI